MLVQAELMHNAHHVLDGIEVVEESRLRLEEAEARLKGAQHEVELEGNAYRNICSTVAKAYNHFVGEVTRTLGDHRLAEKFLEEARLEREIEEAYNRLNERWNGAKGATK